MNSGKSLLQPVLTCAELVDAIYRRIKVRRLRRAGY
jgi:hypothetical protein